jgi:hypothetical protein
MCVLVISTTFVWNIYHSKKNILNLHKNIGGHHVKYQLFSSEFNETWIF